MNTFEREIRQQPPALRAFVTAQRQPDMRPWTILPHLTSPLLTGMGASFHAALWGAYLLRQQGQAALAVEASDLAFGDDALLSGRDALIYISQSGASAEVAPVIAAAAPHALLAVTNDAASPLAQAAAAILPLTVADEQTVATQTYTNTLAALYLLAAVQRRADPARTLDTLATLADELDTYLAAAAPEIDVWLTTFAHTPTQLFVGYGPQAASARQAAQTLTEWAKRPALGLSAGALRHGSIEMVGPETGVVIFTAAGPSAAAAHLLAQELTGWGVPVLRICRGQRLAPGEMPTAHDPLLAAILDLLPVQLFTAALGRQLGIAPGFRYLRKVVTEG